MTIQWRGFYSMGKVYTKQEFIENLEKTQKPFRLVGEYYNMTTKTEFCCLVCGHGWKQKPTVILNTINQCPKCVGRNIIDLCELNDMLNEKNKNIIFHEYVNKTTKSKCECLICHHVWNTTPKSVLKKTGCPRCNDTKYTLETLNYKLETKSIFYVFHEYCGIFDKALCECLTCHHMWKVIPSNILHSRAGCPSCANYGFDPSKPTILYYIKITHNNNIYYKIGITNKTIEDRFKKGEMKIIDVLNIIDYNCGVDAYTTEQKILKEFSGYRYNGEPILSSGGNTEIFIKDIFEGNYEQINYI